MSEHEQEQNRTEQASPFKLKEARDRGQVAKSTELSSALVTLAFVGLLYAGGSALFQRMLRLDAALLSQAGGFSFSESAAAAWLGAALMDTLGLLAPVFLLLVVAGALASFLQTGPIFALEQLKPDLERVNPVAGFKRLLSLRIVVELVKTLLKLALFGYALFAILESLMPALLGLAQAEAAVFARVGLESASALMFKLGLVMLAIALLDTAYVRFDFARRMMMSRREMNEEVKRREGDPKIRARIRELQREARKRSGALKRVPEADVLITNPRHIAVALRYRRDSMPAPQVIAKGAGELALRMKQLARRHGVPVAENRPLARALFLRAALDAPIPTQNYPAVARVLAWVYALRELRGEAPA